MNTEIIEVVDAHGRKHSAYKATCPDCGGDSFHILIINGCNHLQCTACNTSFCQSGDCGCGGKCKPSLN